MQPDDSARIRLALDMCGYAVVPVLSRTEVQHYKNKIYDVLHSVRPDSTLVYPFTPHGAHSQGFVPAYGIAQSEPVQELRHNNTIRATFAGLYGASPSALAVSHDNIFYLGPDVKRDKPPSFETICGDDPVKAVQAALGSSLRLHTDVGDNTYGAECEEALARGPYDYIKSVQGQVLLKSVKCDSGGLVVAAWDVKLDESYFLERSSDFCQLNPKGYAMLRDHLVKICAPAGSLILWRSDLPHANMKADYRSDNYIRLGLFVSWHPVLQKDEAKKKRKIELVMDGYTGTHWPRQLKRWRKPGSHMGNGKGTSKILKLPQYSPELMQRITEAI